MNTRILIADVGGTRSVWRSGLLKEGIYTGPGFHPLIHPLSRLGSLLKEVEGHLVQNAPDKIYIYCTGISNPEISNEVVSVIREIFPQSQSQIASDVTGAAIAGLGKKQGTVMILGTGSHAAAWNGKEVFRSSPSLGYILGDEGSGADIGKCIIRSYYYSAMPEHIREHIKLQMPSSRIELIKELNKHPAPNEYLASFTRIFKDNLDHPWLINLVEDRFKEFVTCHVKGVYTPGPIVGVGSIGCIFADTINRILVDEGFESAHWIKDPSSGIEDYHTTNG